jgi:hypothetical protein
MQTKEYRCFVTGEVIPQARVEYLISEGVPEHMMTSLAGAEKVHRPRKMLFIDDESNYIICDKIDETRIYAAERFSNSSREDEAEEDSEQEAEEETSYKKPKIIDDDN